MQQRTALVVVALALVGLFAAFLLLRRGDETAEKPVVSEGKAARAPKAVQGGSVDDDDDETDESSVRVVGRVVDGNDAPVKDAVISVRRHDAKSSAAQTVRSDPGGAWTIDALAPGTYAVSATAPGFLPAVQRRVEIAAAGEPIVLRMLEGGHRLHGTVRDVTGGTVEGAQVRATPLSLLQTRELDGFGTLAGTEGAYALFVAPGRYRVDVSHADYATQSRTVEVGEGTRAQDFELTPTGVIEGVVVRAGTREPVPHAWVAYHGERRISILPGEQIAMPVGAGAVQADAAGKFRIGGLESGTLSLRARAKGVASHAPTVVALSIAEHVEVEVEVDAAFTVRGRVVVAGDTDTGVAAASVQIGGPGPPGASATADSEGKFVLDGVLAGPIMLTARADGFLAAFPGTRVEVSEDLDDVIVELPRGQSIVGRIEPPQVAEVATELRPENFEGGPMMVLNASTTTESKDDGTFTLSPVPVGATTVVARTAEGLEGEATVRVVEGEATEIVIRLEPRATVRGVVVSGGGKPVAEALVSMRRIREDGKDFRLNVNGRDVGTKTGSSTDTGTFAIAGLAQGEYEVTVSDRYGDPIAVQGGIAAANGRGKITIASASEVEVQIVVDAHDGVISGVVTTAEGDPATDVWVSATAAPRDEPPPREDGPTARSEMRIMLGGDGASGIPSRPPVLTGEDGTFEIHGLDDVDHLVVAEQAGGSARVREVAKPDAKLKLQLAPLGKIRGTVSVDGQVSDGFLVIARGPTARTERVRAGGTFELDRLDPGRYRVEARNLEGSGSVEVEVEAGATADATIPLQHFITVTGRVVDKAGQPIAGLEAMLGEGEDGRIEIKRDGSEEINTTDAEGRFEVECAAGKRVIAFAQPGQPPRAIEFFTAELGKSPLDLGDIVEQEPRGPDVEEDG
jgi:hypothetical protein